MKVIVIAVIVVILTVRIYKYINRRGSESTSKGQIVQKTEWRPPQNVKEFFAYISIMAEVLSGSEASTSLLITYSWGNNTSDKIEFSLFAANADNTVYRNTKAIGYLHTLRSENQKDYYKKEFIFGNEGAPYYFRDASKELEFVNRFSNHAYIEDHSSNSASLEAFFESCMIKFAGHYSTQTNVGYSVEKLDQTIVNTYLDFGDIYR